MRRSKFTRAFTFALLACLVVAVAGCSSGASKQPSRALYSGSEGIILSFPDANALTQYQGDTFVVSMRLLNDGTASINSSNPAILTATFDPSVMRAVDARSSSSDFTGSATQSAQATQGGSASLTDKVFSIANGLLGTGLPVQAPDAGSIAGGSIRVPFTARGRSEFMPVGDIAFVELMFNASTLPPNRASATTPLSVQICYPYTTTFIADICVDRDLLTTSTTSVCSAAAVNAQPQGSPIAVRSVTPRYTPVNGIMQARYEITLENLQGGIVLSPGKSGTTSLDACNLNLLKRNGDGLTEPIYGLAAVTAQVSGTKLKCGSGDSETGIARFDRTTALIVCRFDSPNPNSGFQNGSNYLAPIIIQAHYFYIESTPTQVEVKKR